MAHKALQICLTLLCVSTAIYAHPQGGNIIDETSPAEKSGDPMLNKQAEDLVDLGDLYANLTAHPDAGECAKPPPAGAITIAVEVAEAGIEVCLYLLLINLFYLLQFLPFLHLHLISISVCR